MASLTPEQLRKRERVEALIRLMAPALDMVLKAGEQLSRVVEREDSEYYPPRAGTGAEPPPETRPKSGDGSTRV